MIKLYSKRFIVLVMVVLVMATLFTGCSNQTENENSETINESQNPRVQIEMEDGSKMVLELYPEFAPKTVENFVNLSKAGFYKGLKFHRIMEGFMIQGGDPNGDGTGGSDENIEGEFSENGFSQNTLKHVKGVISMARSADYNSASSQFFIMHGDGSFLDGKYAAFGKLIEGEETLDKLAQTPVDKNPHTGELSVPKEDVVIKEIIVLDNGENK